ncbi:T9SS type A sorting domain-containing protein, partial [bacterium]|nr:T9SS type A sorting domain-containing protein [bacterium]
SIFHASTLAGSLSVEVRILETVPDPGEVMLRAVVTEDDVDACCDPGGGRTWNRVVRRVLDVRPLTVDSPGQIQFEQWQLPLDADWSVVDLHAVVFLQRDTDHDVLGVALAADAGSLLPLPLSGLDESRVNLLPCRPNPLHAGDTRILFTLPDADHARVRILDAAGRVVRVLTDGPRPEGVQEVRWDGTDYRGVRMASGIYVYRLETSAGVQSRKLALVR